MELKRFRKSFTPEYSRTGLLPVILLVMEEHPQVVTRIPLRELRRRDGASARLRRRAMSARDLAEVVREGPVQFVVADVGLPLQWIDCKSALAFWKSEAKPHMSEAAKQVMPARFPGGYYYLASEWIIPGDPAPVIVLSRFPSRERRSSEIAAVVRKIGR